MVTTMWLCERLTQREGIWPGTRIPLVWNPPPVQNMATGSFDALVALAGVQIASFRQSSLANGADTPAERFDTPQYCRYCGICWFQTDSTAVTYCGQAGGYCVASMWASDRATACGGMNLFD